MQIGLPSVSKILIYAFGSWIAALGIFVLGRWLAGLQNEANNSIESAQADNGRQQADQDDQKLNDETSKLPKG